jgi:hypothetical protein
MVKINVFHNRGRLRIKYPMGLKEGGVELSYRVQGPDDAIPSIAIGKELRRELNHNPPKKDRFTRILLYSEPQGGEGLALTSDELNELRRELEDAFPGTTFNLPREVCISTTAHEQYEGYADYFLPQ